MTDGDHAPGRPAAPDDLGRTAARAIASLESYLERGRAARGPIVRLAPRSQLLEGLDFGRWIQRGGMTDAELGHFLDRYLDAGTLLQHPGFMAHQVSVPHPASAVADLVNGMTNNGMAIYEMGPAAVAAETAVVRWMLARVGWQAGDGTLTHGGSLANLTALLAARARVAPDAWNDGVPQDLVVLAPPSCHYSVGRSVAILGLGARAHVPLPVDARGVVIPSQLPDTLRRVRDSGRRVVAVVANACATTTGLYDPIEDIAAFCRDQDLWLHVDGAHGASALVSPRLRSRLAGIEHADSLVWDAHKMLRTSVLCAAVLVREPSALQRAFQQDPTYFRPTGDAEFPNLYDRTVECTKNGLGLKLFLVLAASGEAALAHHVEMLYARCERFHAIVAARPRFECPYTPQSNILCFRYAGSDVLQEEIRQRLLAEGDFYLSSSQIGSRRFLRVVLMNEATDEAAWLRLLDRIEALASPARTD